MRSRRRLTQVLVAILIGGLALAITWQVRDEPADDYQNARSEDLVELLKSLDAANQRLDRQITDLTNTRDDLLDSSKRSRAAQDQARAQADALAILAGTAPAMGPGVVVTISDPEGGVDAGALLDAIEELRNAGAEAIAINGTVRVVGQTYFIDTDESIRIGGRDVKPPYVVEAIGDTDTMATATQIPGGLVDTIERRGGEVSVTREKVVGITALADVRAPEYARPDS
ncbi:MAG: DUF881 domain-containing protein [Aeromicrobium sp.]|uniref:DUF881 domain-containing protein n=1 Tax=Aeromicrobium sp. TaxID=1871063 RepID=UPI003C56C0E5